MKMQKLGTVILGAWIISVGTGCESPAKKINPSNQSVEASGVVEDFIPGARLSRSEVGQVLALAKDCGLDSPAVIRTFEWLPTLNKGISVKSVDRVEGRNTIYDSVYICRKNWVSPEPDKDAKWVGDFWAGADDKYSTLLRRYDFEKESIQIQIGKGVDTTIADKVIALIEANDVRFETDAWRNQFERLKRSKPTSISRRASSNRYHVDYGDGVTGRDRLQFEWKDGQVLVTGVSKVYI